MLSTIAIALPDAWPRISKATLPASVPGELPPGIAGVIGTRVLYQFLATIDYPHGLLVPDHFIFVRARIGSAPEALFNVDTGGGGIGVQATKVQLDAAAIVPMPRMPCRFAAGAAKRARCRSRSAARCRTSCSGAAR